MNKKMEKDVTLILQSVLFRFCGYCFHESVRDIHCPLTLDQQKLRLAIEELVFSLNVKQAARMRRKNTNVTPAEGEAGK